ncbi:MAG: transporter [Bacteroidota bacterium]
MDFKPTLLCFLLFASSVSCWAQGQNTDPIVTDRPGKSNGTQVLTKGSFQIEVGGGNSQASGVVSLYSGLVARIGLPWFEVRVGPGWSWSVNNSLAGGDNTQHQVSNLIEAKIALWNGERFHSALMPSFHLGYLPDNLAFGGIFVADYELADRWTLLPG